MRTKEFSKKLKIIRNFSKSAERYDKNSHLQKALEDILINKISDKVKNGSFILDIGSGTGSLCGKISKINPKAYFYGLDLAFGMVRYSVKELGCFNFIQADAEKIPIKENIFDLVVSNSVYQWVGDLEEAFFEAKRVLKDKGEFHFVFFGGKTLWELKNSFDTAYKFFAIEPVRHTENFIKIGDIDAILKKSGFKKRSVSASLLEKKFHDVEELMEFLKLTGAVNTNLSGSFGLGRKKVILKMKDIYKNLYRDNDGVKATFEIFFGSAVK